jgi:hypothetical protein
MKKSYLREVIKEILDEMSTSAAAGGYLTKNAFSKKGQGKNVATKTAEKLGYKTVQPKKYPYSTKMIDYKKLNN